MCVGGGRRGCCGCGEGAPMNWLVERWWMTGQEGKTALQLQIDIPENVFVFCEKWCCNSHLHAPPPLLLLQPLRLLPLSLVPARAFLSLSLSLLPSVREWQPTIHFHHSERYFPLPSILTAPDHYPDRPPHCSHCVLDSYCLVAIETWLELLLVSCIPSWRCGI